jgi:hypothetical protein
VSQRYFRHRRSVEISFLCKGRINIICCFVLPTTRRFQMMMIVSTEFIITLHYFPSCRHHHVELGYSSSVDGPVHQLDGYAETAADQSENARDVERQTSLVSDCDATAKTILACSARSSSHRRGRSQLAKRGEFALDSNE